MSGGFSDDVTRILAAHRRGIIVVTSGDEQTRDEMCSCGWRGPTWEEHAAAVLSSAVSDRLADAEAKVREFRDYIDRRAKSGYYDAYWRKGEVLDDLNAILEGQTAAEIMNPGRAALSGGDTDG
jgi:hypothetical protein